MAATPRVNPRVLWVAAAATIWAAVIWRWSPAWSAAPEQAYGWMVPLLALGLGWERWSDRPPVEPPAGWLRHAAIAGLVSSFPILAVLLVVLTANPLWPMIQALAVGAAAATTGLILLLTGGKRRAAHFAFPVLFMATALSWPAVITTRIVNSLVAGNAELAAVAVAALGHPAMVHGAVIELAGGVVGIDEACSGLRSLQTVWMAGWFFGELFRLGLPRRLALVGLALASAVAINALRTTALTWLAASRGLESADRWHDRAGAAELIVTLTGVAWLAWRLGRKGRIFGAEKRMPTSELAVRGGAIACLGAAMVLVAPEVWYGWREYTRPGQRVQWALRSPGATWRTAAVPERTKTLLNASSVAGIERVRPEGSEQAFVARWDDDVARAMAAEWHDPTVCVPSSGLDFAAVTGTIPLEIDGTEIGFSAGTFSTADGEQWVFYCHWDAWLGRGRESAPAAMSSVPAWRLERVREGRRRGDASYVVLVTPARGRAQAEAWLREWAPQLIERR